VCGAGKVKKKKKKKKKKCGKIFSPAGRIFAFYTPPAGGRGCLSGMPNAGRKKRKKAAKQIPFRGIFLRD
jgi:hypothetical protein